MHTTRSGNCRPMQVKGTTILVTGGLGFIGINLVEALLRCDDNKRVLIVDRAATKKKHWPVIQILQDPRVSLHGLDILEQAELVRLVRGADLVYHLAAETHVQYSIRDPRSFIETNILGTFNVLEAIRNCSVRLVYLSSSEVYGQMQDIHISERDMFNPCSPYAASKLAAEQLAYAYHKTYGIDTTILRLFNNYGPRQGYEKVIPMFICSAICGLPLPMQGDGSETRDWSFVNDTCLRLMLLQDRRMSGEVINLGSGQEVSVKEIAERILALADKPNLPIIRFPRRPSHVLRQRADTNKVDMLLGPASTDLHSGLTETYAWFVRHQDWWRPCFEKLRQRIIGQLATPRLPENTSCESISA